MVLQTISNVSAESSRPLHRPLAGHLVCQYCVLYLFRNLRTPASLAWIVHGILDSIVDSFFPLVKEIEEHVVITESVVYNEDNPASTTSPIPLSSTRALRVVAAGEKVIPATSFIDEKRADVASVKTAMTQFSLPGPTCGLMLRRWGCAISGFFSFCRSKPKSKPRMISRFAGASADLYRMSRTRRLATSMARLLVTKPEVIAGIRKRLLSSDGPDADDDAEVAIYFGDVQGEVARYRSVCVS